MVGAAILYSIACAVMFNAASDPLSWLHFPTRIIAGLAAIAVMDWRAKRKAVAQPT